MKIAFCSSEIYPFAKTGGLGDVCGSLPIALEQEDVEVALFMPGYRCVGQSGVAIEPLNEYVSRAQVGSNIHVYFIDHGIYFDRVGLYGDQSGDYPDNIERFSYFCDQVLSLLKQIDFQPDIVHCHDWQTALIPVYLKEKYNKDPFYAKIKSILTIHNLAFQGVFPKEQYEKLQLGNHLWNSAGFEFYDQVNLLKAGILFSDQVTTVSPRYAQEIQTKQFGCGLEHDLQTRPNSILGILNGIDRGVWNPKEDNHLAQTYTKNDFEQAKERNKIQLQKEYFLKVDPDVPLFGFVGRLAHQKGLDLLIDSLLQMIQMNAQLIVLGVGDERYQDGLYQIADQYPEHVAVCTTFNESLGHKIYGASDFFLMPSQFEPCGLSQMISLSYGAIPIVFKTGGLADTVHPFNLLNSAGNGFVFTDYTKELFIKQIKNALNVYQNKKKFNQLRKNTFENDFSWASSSQEYINLYHEITEA